MKKSLKKHLGKIHQGDCVKGLAKLPDESVDLVFADPPFNIGYKYDEYDDRLDEQKYVDWSREWMEQVHRVLKSNGTFWLAIGDEYAAELKVEAKKLGFVTRNWVIWYYTFGVHCKLKFTRSHAHLFYLIKDEKDFTFNRDAVAVPSARQLVYNDKRSNPKGRTPDDTWILRPQDCPDGFTGDQDTWYFPRVAGTFKERAGFHGCQMPEQLLGRIIRGCTNEGEIVVDPFAGSSTTLAVAKKLGRKFFGYELSSDYVKFGKKRLDAAVVGGRLDGAEEPKVSAPTTADAAKIKRRKKPATKVDGAREPAVDAKPPKKTSASKRAAAKPVGSKQAVEKPAGKTKTKATPTKKEPVAKQDTGKPAVAKKSEVKRAAERKVAAPKEKTALEKAAKKTSAKKKITEKPAAKTAAAEKKSTKAKPAAKKSPRKKAAAAQEKATAKKKATVKRQAAAKSEAKSSKPAVAQMQFELEGL